MNNTIFHYRLADITDDDLWRYCVFNDNSNLEVYSINPPVSIHGQPVLQQHKFTYITGRDLCHAHHYAKMLAVAELLPRSSKCSPVPSFKGTASTATSP